MSKITRIKEMLRALVVSLSSLSTDKGVLVFDEDEIAVDVAVRVVDTEGNESPAEDGEYTLEDGRVVVVADGKVTEIREAQEPEMPATEEETVETVEAEEEKKEDEEESDEEESNEEESEPEAEESDEEEEKKVEAEDEVDPRIAELEAENEALKARIAELEARIAELEQEPASEPIVEEYKKQFTVKTNGDQRLENLSRIVNAKR